MIVYIHLNDDGHLGFMPIKIVPEDDKMLHPDFPYSFSDPDQIHCIFRSFCFPAGPLIEQDEL